MRAQAQQHLSEQAGLARAAGRPAAGAGAGCRAPYPSPVQGATPFLLSDLCFPSQQRESARERAFSI